LRRGSWRPTSAHESIFMLTKGKGYYGDREAVKTKAKESSVKRIQTGWDGNTERDYIGGRQNNLDKYMGSDKAIAQSSGANLRNVWRLKQQNYKGSHYAVFPPSLPETCIKASAPLMCCPVCGAGWARIIEDSVSIPHQGAGYTQESTGRNDGDRPGTYLKAAPTMLGWRATCDHPHTRAETVKAVVLDPFAGSGTTVIEANKLGRRGIGFDLSLQYLKDNALVRSGLAALGEWSNGKQTGENDLTGLPMFRGE